MLKVIKNDNYLHILISFGLFSQVFGQVNEWPISKLHEIIRVLHLRALFFLFSLMI